MPLPMDKPWRFRCPTEHRHATLRKRSYGYYCRPCGERFDELYDMVAETTVSVA